MAPRLTDAPVCLCDLRDYTGDSTLFSKSPL